MQIEKQRRVSQIQALNQFSLVRFQPGDIILMHKVSRKPYRYYQLNQQINLLPEIAHPYLLRPIMYKNGAIYPKGDSCLKEEIEKRRRFYDVEYFTIEEICNTFAPIIQCIEYLHSNGIVHGSLSSNSVLFFQNGSIMLKDWIYREEGNLLYSDIQERGLNKSDDLRALGLIIAESASFLPVKQLEKMSVQEIIIEMLKKYPSSFCYSMIILLKGLYKQIKIVPSLMSNDEKSVKDQEVLNIFQKAQSMKIQRDKQRKRQQQIKLKAKKQQEQRKNQQKKQKQKQVNTKKVLICQSNNSNMSSIQGSPTKKFNVKKHNSNSGLKLEDTENKKVFNQEVKKKQIEKITKIIQRSNAFVNELMARKNNQKKTIKANNSMVDAYCGTQNSARKVLLKGSPKIGSPSKRLRSINKKK